MLSAGAWKRNQANTILFVMVDSSGLEVSGLGSGFTLQISKVGASFVNSSGTKSEVGSGWYKYISTAAEADTIGPVGIKVTHASTVQQNLEYVVEGRNASSVEFTYTLTSTLDSSPIDGAHIQIATDSAGINIVWSGYTDAFGVARDSNGAKPFLDIGTYYIFRQHADFTFVNPDIEAVGP